MKIHVTEYPQKDGTAIFQAAVKKGKRFYFVTPREGVKTEDEALTMARNFMTQEATK